jgi:hypothetical protein
VHVEGSPHAYAARVFVVATGSASFTRMLPDGDRKLEPGALRPTRHLLTVNLVVKTAALPPAMGESVLALGDGPDEALLVQVLPARRDAKKGGAGDLVPDERVVSAASFVAAGATADDVARQARRTREALAELIPFFDRHLVRESVPTVAASAERRREFVAHPLYDLAADAPLGVCGIPCRALKNVVFAGREVVPGLGLEGEFHAGVQAAAATQALLGRRELLR